MKRLIKLLLGVSILGFFFYTIYFLYQKSEGIPEFYKTESPIITSIVKKSVATGSVVPRKEVNIKSQVSGVVEKLFVEAGQFAKEGQVIAKIRINPNMVNLNNAQSNLNKAKINFADAKKEFARYQKLFEDKVISEVEFNNYRLSFNRAKEDLESAENNYLLIKEGASSKSGQTSNLVRATVTGMILDIPVKEGSFVIEGNTFNEGTTIGTIADMNEMIFTGKIDESEVGKIKEGMDLDLTIAAIENKKYKAKLEFISPKGVAVEGAIQFEIKAAVMLDEKEFLRSGYSASADIILDKREKVLAIKEGLLQFGKDSTFVEVEKAPQIFEKRLVKTGLSDGINVEVISGIDKNEKIKVFEKVADSKELEAKAHKSGKH